MVRVRVRVRARARIRVGVRVGVRLRVRVRVSVAPRVLRVDVGPVRREELHQLEEVEARGEGERVLAEVDLCFLEEMAVGTRAHDVGTGLGLGLG